MALKKSNTAAAIWYQKAAEQQNAIALSNLGNFYQYGKGVQQNTSKAIEYYDQAANKGFYAAYCSLGDLYKSFSDNVSIEKAITAYQQGAKKGLKNCQFGLGYIYDELTNEKSKALVWYQKAANQNHAAALNNLGYMYREGLVVKKDTKKEFEYTLKSAKLGNPTALNNLGNMYKTGRGVTVDKHKAYHYYLKAAAQNKQAAMKNLTELHRNGIIVKATIDQAITLFEQEAKAGNPEAAYLLGQIYKSEEYKLKNNKIAKKWYAKAIEKKYWQAYDALAAIYWQNPDNTIENQRKAIELLTQSAQITTDNINFAIGLFFASGTNMEPQYQHAIKYYNLGAKENHAASIK